MSTEPASSSILQTIEVYKTFNTEHGKLEILHGINLDIPRSTTVAIVGPSGSGKTTLLGLLAGLDLPSSGSIILDGQALEALSEDERAIIRNQKVGFVFQNFQLLPTLTALENVMLPLEIVGAKQAKAEGIALLEQVGLKERIDHYPIQLSGGEQQRVALARAFIHKPSILFADEPTGNLDEENSERVSQLLFDLNEKSGTTLITVTHDLEFAAKMERIIKIRDGSLVSD